MGGRSIYTVMRQEAKIRNTSCDISNLSLEIKKESVEVFWLSPHGSDNTSPACWFPATAHIHLWIPLGSKAGLDAPGLPCGSSPVALAVLEPGGPLSHIPVLLGLQSSLPLKLFHTQFGVVFFGDRAAVGRGADSLQRAVCLLP